MLLEEALYTYLAGDSELAVKLAGRIYPLILPQKCALPALAYTPVSLNRAAALCKDTGYVRQAIQLTVHAGSMLQALSLVSLLRKKLQNFSGSLGGLTVGGVLILSEGAFYEKETSGYSAYIELEFHYMEEA